ncbi:DUF397 domain-containing protein [Streptomyces sp. NPDC002911]
MATPSLSRPDRHGRPGSCFAPDCHRHAERPCGTPSQAQREGAQSASHLGTHPAPRWRRSSRSTGVNNCVETAPLRGDQLAVRDSRDTDLAAAALLCAGVDIVRRRPAAV